MRQPERVQQISGWIIIAVAFVHLAVTFLDYDKLSLRALWFVGSGFALLLIGGLNVVTGNLVAADFGRLRGLRWLTLLSDGCGLVLGLMFVVLTSGEQPQGPVLVLLFVVAGIAQMSRR